MPDANKNKTLSQIAGAAFGAAGQRCMALSVAIFVGKSKEWIGDLVVAAKKLKVNAGHVPGTDVGPVISPQSKTRILELVESGVKDGATLALCGRNVVVPGYEKGNFVGPTILTDVKVYLRRFILWSHQMMAYIPIVKLFFIATHEVLHGGDIWTGVVVHVRRHDGSGNWADQQQPVRQWNGNIHDERRDRQDFYQ